MASSSVVSGSLCYQVLREASEKRVLNSPATVWIVVSLVSTKFFL